MREFDKIMAIARHPEFIEEYKEFDKEHQKDHNSRETYTLGKKISVKWGFHPITIVNVNRFFIETGKEPKSWIGKASPIVIRDFDSNSKKLHLVVDVTKKKEKILESFERVLKEFRPQKKNNERDKGNIISPWKIYDMVKGGKNLNQIARKLSTIKGDASCNIEPMSWYKRVERAFKKANEMINLIDE